MMSVISAQSTARKIPPTDADEDDAHEGRVGDCDSAIADRHARRRRSPQAT